MIAGGHEDSATVGQETFIRWKASEIFSQSASTVQVAALFDNVFRFEGALGRVSTKERTSNDQRP
jgi:hypothetical protein